MRKISKLFLFGAFIFNYVGICALNKPQQNIKADAQQDLIYIDVNYKFIVNDFFTLSSFYIDQLDYNDETDSYTYFVIDDPYSNDAEEVYITLTSFYFAFYHSSNSSSIYITANDEPIYSRENLDNSRLENFIITIYSKFNYIELSNYVVPLTYSYPFSSALTLYTDALSEGIDEVINNYQDYDLVTYDDYIDYGSNQFDTGFSEGIDYVINDPSEYGFYTQSQVDSIKIEQYNQGVQSGYSSGFAEGELLNDTTGFIGSIFSGITSILNVQIIGAITLGNIILIPLAIGIVSLVVKLFG